MSALSRRTARTTALAFAALATASACAPRRTDDLAPERLVWPAPPDSARIEYVRAIRFAADVTGRRPGALRRLATGGQEALFLRPYGVAADGADLLYVADPIQPGVWRLDLAGGDISQLGTSGSGALTRPCCIATTSVGRVYVTDVDARRVVVFDRDRRFLFAFGGRDVLERPGGLAVDETRHRIYVADLGRHRITVHDLESGRLLFDFGAPGDGDGQFNMPVDVGVDSLGRIYVVDALNFRVQRFTPDGTFQGSFGSAGDAPGHFARPKGIALDAEMNIYVVDAAFANFQVFDRDFTLLLPVGQNGSGAGQMLLPAGIAIACDQSILVADGLNGRVVIFRRVDRVGHCLSPDSGSVR